MINQKQRMIDLIEDYKARKEPTFEKYNCIERSILLIVVMDSAIPLSRLGDYILLMKAYKIISVYQTALHYAGYIFSEENYKKFKEGV